MVTLLVLLGSSSNHDDGEGNMKIKKKYATGLTDKQKENPERAAHFLANFLAIVARVTFSNVIEMAVRSYL